MNIIEEIISTNKAIRAEEKKVEADKLASLVEKFQETVTSEIQNDPTLAWILKCGESEFKANEFVFNWNLSEKECHKMELCPIALSSGRTSRDANQVYFNFYTYNHTYNNSSKNHLTIADALEYARDNYLNWKAYQNRKNAEALIARSPNFYQDDSQTDLNAVQVLCDRLIATDPDNENTYKSQAQAWTDAISQRNERNAKRERTDAIAAQYFQDRLTWMNACCEVYRHNLEVVKNVQEKYTKPVQIFELQFAIVAFDSDEKFVEKEKVYVRSAVQGKNGIFLSMDNTPIKYYHPIKLTPVTADQKTGLSYCDFVNVPAPQFIPDLDVRFVIGEATQEIIQEELQEAGLLPFPESPERPDIHYKLLENAEDQARQVYAEGSPDYE